MPRLRNLPRICGIAQNVHGFEQPSETFRYACAVPCARTRGRSSYSRTDILRFAGAASSMRPVTAAVIASSESRPTNASISGMACCRSARYFMTMQPATTSRCTPLALPIGNLEDRIDRLLLGRVDEAAGIDDDDVRRVEIVRDLDLGFLAQLAEHDLAVDEILRAAEGDHPHAADRLVRWLASNSHEQPWNRGAAVRLSCTAVLEHRAAALVGHDRREDAVQLRQLGAAGR